MKIKLLASAVTLAALTACGGGDIKIDAANNSVSTDNTDNSVGDNSNNVTNSGGNPGGNEIVCASYTDENNQVQSGIEVDGNCEYSSAFVSAENPILVDITFQNIGDGAHIFDESLYIGQNYSSLADAAAAGITRGGDGPTLTIRAGVTLAFNEQKALGITRGARIDARGTASAPITVTGVKDVQGNLDSPEEFGTWGGMVVMGFGFYNDCTYATGWDFNDPATLTLTDADCTADVEGLEGTATLQFGGAVADDNSGVLEYFIVKHAGSELSTGDELNGITFGAVGTGTTINNLEIYSNVDDGIEFFGGGANVTNYVALYVRDDSIDLDGGYYGTIQNALVIQGNAPALAGAADSATKTGAHCVESDGHTGDVAGNVFDEGYTGRATINNLTCISSAKGVREAGNSDPGAGINLEERHELTVNRSIVTTAYTADATQDFSGDAPVAIDPAQVDFTNYCFQMEDDTDLANADAGLININTTIFMCSDISASKARTGDVTLPTSGNTGQQFLESQDNVVATGVAADGSTPPNSTNFNILNGFYSVPVSMMVVDGTAVDFADDTVTMIGAVSEDNDWTAGWTYGLHEGNRGQALWFE